MIADNVVEGGWFPTVPRHCERSTTTLGASRTACLNRWTVGANHVEGEQALNGPDQSVEASLQLAKHAQAYSSQRSKTRSRPGETFPAGFAHQYVSKIADKIAREALVQADRTQIEERMNFTRENYRMMREALFNIIYWTPDSGQPVPDARDVVDAAKTLS
jgi:hypothetical protein